MKKIKNHQCPRREYRFDIVQGGALNRGLFFADLPLSLLGAVSGKIYLSYYGNIAAGTSGSAVAVEIACRRDTTQSSARNVKILRFSKASAIAKTWFSM
jgi:hypothetical protein